MFVGGKGIWCFRRQLGNLRMQKFRMNAFDPEIPLLQICVKEIIKNILR